MNTFIIYDAMILGWITGLALGYWLLSRWEDELFGALGWIADTLSPIGEAITAGFNWIWRKL